MSYPKRAVLCLLITLAAVSGQVSTGVITGQVTDPSGAPVSAATVRIIREATNSQTTLMTNPAGVFAVPFLAPGVYSAEVTASGFQPSVMKEVVLPQNTQVRLDFQLTLGSGSETITVESATPLVEEANAQVTSVTPSRKILAFPRMETGLLSLALLTPGVQAGFREGDLAVNGSEAARSTS